MCGCNDVKTSQAPEPEQEPVLSDGKAQVRDLCPTQLIFKGGFKEGCPLQLRGRNTYGEGGGQTGLCSWLLAASCFLLSG